ncbi:unnamed protein product [Amoebophrya sp. A25]|nr:unnamed protein product [Amoebophrya sp. A25]|eukprot:GSA25T00022226001.1
MADEVRHLITRRPRLKEHPLERGEEGATQHEKRRGRRLIGPGPCANIATRMDGFKGRKGLSVCAPSKDGKELEGAWPRKVRTSGRNRKGDSRKPIRKGQNRTEPAGSQGRSASGAEKEKAAQYRERDTRIPGQARRIRRACEAGGRRGTR